MYLTSYNSPILVLMELTCGGQSAGFSLRTESVDNEALIRIQMITICVFVWLTGPGWSGLNKHNVWHEFPRFSWRLNYKIWRQISRNVMIWVRFLTTKNEKLLTLKVWGVGVFVNLWWWSILLMFSNTVRYLGVDSGPSPDLHWPDETCQ